MPGVYLRRLTLAGAGALVVAAALVWVGLTQGVGLGAAVPWALDRFSPVGWALTVDDVEGSWLSPVTLAGVRARVPGWEARADSVVLRYRPAAVLRRRIDIESLRVFAPHVSTSADGAEPVDGDDRTAAGPSEWAIALDDVRVVDGTAELKVDSALYRVSRLHLDAAASIGDGGSVVRVESLTLTLEPPAGAAPADVSVAAELAGRNLTVHTLSLRSERSSVQGSGVVTLPDGERPRATDATLLVTAEPLDLRDLPWDPGAAWSSSVTGRLETRSVGDSLVIDLVAEGSRGETLTVEGRLGSRPADTGPALEGSVRATATGLPIPEPVHEEGGSHRTGEVAADLAVAMARLDPSSAVSIGGTVAHRPRDGSEFPAFTSRVELDVGQDRDLVWSAAVRIGGGALQGRGEARFLPAGLEASARPLTVTDLDLSALSPALPPSRLSGRAEFEIGRVGERLSGEAQIRMAPGSVGTAELDSAQARIRLAGGTLTGWVESSVPGGSIRADVRSRPFDAPPRITLENGRIRSLRLPHADTARMVVNGAFDGHATLLDGDLVAHVEMALDDSRLGAVSLTGGSATADLEGGAATFEARFDLEEGGTAELSATVAGIDDRADWATHLVGSGTLRATGGLWAEASADTLRASVSGVGGTAGVRRLDATAELRGGAWQDVLVDSARLALRLDSTALRLDTLSLVSNVLEAEASGDLPTARGAPGLVDLQGRVLDLEPLGSRFGFSDLRTASGTFRASLEGRLDSVAVRATAGLDALANQGVQAVRLDLDATGTLVRDDSGSPEIQGRMNVGIDRITSRHAEIRSVEIAASGDANEVTIEVTADVDDTRTGELLVRVDPRPDRRQVRVERVELSLDEDRWRLTEPALVSYRQGLSIDRFELSAGPQRIAVSGTVDSLGAIELDATIDSTNIGTVADLVGLPVLDGWVDGELRVRGTTHDPRGRLDLVAELGREGDQRARVDLALDAGGSVVTVDGRVSPPNGAPFTVAGTIPGFPLATGDPVSPAASSDGVDLRVRSDGFALAWLNALLDPAAAADLQGRLRVDGTVGGSLESPGFEGELTIDSLQLHLPALGVTWRDGRVRARGDGVELRLDTAFVRAGNGTARAQGTVALDGLAEAVLDLDLVLDEFRAIRNAQYRAVTSGSLDVSGTLAQPEIDGDLELLSLDVYLDEQITEDGLEDVELTEEDFRMLRERFGFVPDEEDGPRLMDRISADLRIELGRDSWIRKRTNPEISLAFTGDLEAALRPGEEIRAQGTVRAIGGRGYIEQFGKRFQLAEGTVELDGPIEQAHADVRAEYTIPSRGNPDEAEVTILLNIEGTQADLRLTLSSEPTMENGDIISYLATGRPASSGAALSGSGSGGLVTAGAGLGLDQLAGVIEDAAAGNVGLDVVEIRRDGLRGATLAAGKYITPRVYVGFAQPLSLRDRDAAGGEARSEVEIEYEAYRWLVLNLEGSGSTVRFFLRGRRAY